MKVHRAPTRRWRRHITVAASAATAATAVLAGCSSASQTANGDLSCPSGRIGLSLFSIRDLPQAQIQRSVEKAAEDAGLRVVTTDADQRADRQLTDVENLVGQSVCALIINPADSAAIVPAVRRANSAGIPVFTVDRVPDGGDVALHVAASNAELGRQAGEQMVALLTQKNGRPAGRVLQITGDLGASVARERRAGFEEVLKAYPDIQLTTQEAADWDPARGADITRAVVGSGDRVDGVYFHSEYIGAGIVPALDQLGQRPAGDPGHIIVIGIDGSPEGLNWVRNGQLDATISQPVSDFGTVVVQKGVLPTLSGEKLTGGQVVQQGAIWSPATLNVDAEPCPTINLSVTLVTNENVDDARLWGNTKPDN